MNRLGTAIVGAVALALGFKLIGLTEQETYGAILVCFGFRVMWL